MPAPKRIARLLSPLALLALCAGSPPPARYADRLKEFEARAAARKKELGYSQVQIDALFPAPRIALTGRVAFPVIRPGQTGQVHALFNPPLAEGALVAFDCDGVLVSNFKQKATSLEATITVPLFHEPRTCSLFAHQPVSLRTGSVPAFRVDGTYVWSLTLSNKATVRWTSRVGQPNDRSVPSTWQAGGTTEQHGLFIEHDGEGGRFVVEVEDEGHGEEESVTAPRDSPVVRMRAYEARATALAAKVESCEKLRRDQRLACIDRYQSQIQDLLAQRSSLTSSHSSWHSSSHESKKHSAMCEDLVLDVARDGKITGTAQGCAGGRSATVTGTLTVAAP